MSLVDLNEVDYEARALLATTPSGDYERWALEIFRRRYAKETAEVEIAEAAFREACKGGTFTVEEAAAHKKAFNAAEIKRSNSRASISHLVRMAAGELEFAKKLDKWAAADPEYRYATLPGSPEEKRDKALMEATEQMITDIDDVDQDEIGFSRGSFAGPRGGRSRKYAIVEAFEKRKAEIEEEYYAARI
jgi:hypothetical protein